MHLKLRFPLKRFLRNEIPIEAVKDIWRGFSGRPKDRRLAEAYEASLFGWCLQIWSGMPLSLWFPDEENCDYKGIDFFLVPLHKPTTAAAFQLLEFSGKYTSAECAESFGAWVAEKKFHKGDEKVELVIRVRDLRVDLDLSELREAMSQSPFLRTVLLCMVEDSSGKQGHFVAYLQGDSTANAFVDCSKGSMLESTGPCPIFLREPDT